MASSVINQQTSTNGGFLNLAPPDQDYYIDLLRGLFLAPKGAKITSANAVNLLTFLNGKTMEVLPSNRWQKSSKFRGLEVQGEGVKRQTAGYGDSRKTADPTIVLRFQVWGGESELKAWRSLEGKQDAYDIFLWDDKNVLVGEDLRGTNGDDALGGLDISDIAVEQELPDQDKKASIYVSFSLADTTQWLDRKGFIETGFNIPVQVTGVQNVKLQNQNGNGGAVASDGKITIAPLVGSKNMVTLYPTELVASGGTAAWVARIRDTGVNVPITAAVVIPGIGVQLTLTLTGITTGVVIEVTLKDLTALNTAGIKGFEAPQSIVFAAP